MKCKLLLIVFLFGCISCKKDTKTFEPEAVAEPVTYGNLTIEFENVVDTAALQFGVNYKNQIGDTFKLLSFAYYISNIIVTKSDNSTFIEPNSYHLIDHSIPQSSIITLKNVPMGSYKSISFMIGVDSDKNTSGANTGDLDPSYGMYWPWIGYIMLKFEATSPQSGDFAKGVYYHIGGYKGANSAQRNFNIDFSATTANVSTSNTPKIRLQSDVLEVFKNPTLVSFNTMYDVTSVNADSKTIADNYADMIRLKHVYNH
jgi:hypothetical protein